MLHVAQFHQLLHCLLRQKRFSKKEVQFYLHLKILTCDPTVYTMDHLKFIESSNQKEEYIYIKELKLILLNLTDA